MAMLDRLVGMAISQATAASTMQNAINAEAARRAFTPGANVALAIRRGLRGEAEFLAFKTAWRFPGRARGPAYST
jgi:hypothetical protein